MTSHNSSRHAGFQEQDLGLYRSFEISNLAFTRQDSVQTPFNKTHARPMLPFLHLKYANHKNQTYSHFRNSVIIIFPVLLKPNDLQ